MKWGLLLGMSTLVGLIIIYEWPKLKPLPKKDKLSFFVLVFMGWFLSLFDLPNIPGPTSMIESLFKPFSKMLE
ncbi:hypothetical protein [Brevibacillus reuszeri]|uniref:hypothetical protein n=1 Tax=Brevibacillus reuszeri TaxID=54915 RepID=UPI000CCC6868|nr:hypothetical protein [Brevibacillus reuszeri]